MPGEHASSAAPVVIVGAGPAGLTAGWELAKLGRHAVVCEQDDVVGGISRTVSYKGYRFDIGGHRFFTKSSLVWEVWREVLGDDFLVRPRLSRIYYDGTFFDYPLKPLNALSGLGLVEAARIGLSYLKIRLFPEPEERNFEQWVTNRFGRRLFEIFFKTYTEKVWGIPCSEIGADWAAQRIKNLDLTVALKRAILGNRQGSEMVQTLIDRFHYPRHGPGMMWERCRDLLARQGIETLTGTCVVKIRHVGGRVNAAAVRRDGVDRELEAGHVLSSMPIPQLLRALDPPPPPEILAAGARLRFRDFLTVVLIVDQAEVFPDNWIYIHSPKVKLGRIQNFKNWSPEMVPDPAMTALGLEYFVQEGDELWDAPDDELAELGRREVAQLGLVDPAKIVDSTVVRMPKAYPVYDSGYQEALAVVRRHLAGYPNLQLIGRNGQHRYNNQDHSMLTAIYAARNVAGERHDIWSVNVEQEYHEEHRGTVGDKAVGDEAVGDKAVGDKAVGDKAVRAAGAGDRAVPQRFAASGIEDRLRLAFARYHPVALGTAIGTVAGLGLFVATVVLLLGPEPRGPNLSLLGNYFLGYQVTWPGAFVGLAEAGAGGFAFGWILARAINLLVGWVELELRRELELERLIDPFDERDGE